MTITQSTPIAIVNYGNFSIGAGNTVNIVQPNAQAAILNRVTGTTPSTIAGTLNAKGQVFLINPNGIAITNTGAIAVGSGFVASTLAMSDAEFLGTRHAFTGKGASAAVSNAGLITIGSGGYAALLAGTISNAGHIVVPLGKIGLGSGEMATLDVSGNGFLQVAMPTTAGGTGVLIQSSGILKAGSGLIVITAATAAAAARNAINLSGVVSASGLSGQNGAIVIDGGVGGAVAINTPMAVYGAGSVTINYDTASPTNLVFGPTGSVNYVNGNGSIAIVPVSGQALTINGNAYTLIYGMGEFDAIDGISALNSATIAQYGPGLAGNYAMAGNFNPLGKAYLNPLISSGRSSTSVFSGTLEGLGHTISNLTIKGYDFAVGLIAQSNGTIRDIGLVGGSFSAVPNTGPTWVGSLVGETLGGTIANAFSSSNVTTNIRSTADATGGLVGKNGATITNSYSTGSSAGGGLVGTNYGLITHSYATGSAQSAGLVAENDGTIVNSYATGNVLHGGGGLVGVNQGVISNSYATGNVTGPPYIYAYSYPGTGGLVGGNFGTITNSYATGTVTGTTPTSIGQSIDVGGLVGWNSGTINTSYATGNVSTGNLTQVCCAGGLVGFNEIFNIYPAVIVNSYYDSQTTGRSVGIDYDNNNQSANITGLTTAQLQGRLPAGFDPAIWATGAGLYPYLLSLGPTK